MPNKRIVDIKETCLSDPRSPKIRTLMLLVTNSCNLNCVYCYESHKTSHKMDFDTAKRAILDVFDETGFDGVSIQFMGGEPLLAFPLIKDVSEWLWSKNIKYPYSLFAATNGTLLNEDMKVWFTANKHRISLGLSFDGDVNTQNTNRSNSASLVDLDYFRDTWPESSVKMTVSTESLDNLCKNVVFLEEKGFTKIKTDLAYMHGWTKQHLVLWNEQLSLLKNYYLGSGRDMHCSLFNTPIDAILSEERHAKRCSCGEEMSCVDWDGTIYPCQMFAPISMDSAMYNKVKDIDFADAENFQVQECRDCVLQSCCPGCAGCNLKFNGVINRINPFYCKVFMIQIFHTLDYQLKVAEKIENDIERENLKHDINKIITSLKLN